MSEWKEFILEDVIENFIDYRGKTPRKTDKGVPLLTAKIIKLGRILEPNEFISPDDYHDWMTRGYPDIGDVVMTTEAPLGEVAVIKDKYVALGQRLITLHTDIKKCDSYFLKYYLLSPAGQESLQARSSGSTVEGIKSALLKKMEILLPPLPEQRAIASVLSSLDDKIDLLHRQNKTLEAMAETLFRQWFVEEADEGWEEGVIADLIDFNPNRKLAKGTCAQYLEMASLSTTTFMPTDWYERDFSSGMKFMNGDTLIARITPCLENGKTAFITFLNKNDIGWGSTEYIVMRPKQPFHPFFAYTLARNKDFRDYAEGCLEGSSGRQRVNIDHLMIYPIALPDDKTIEQFNSLACSIVPKLSYNAEQIRTLEKLRANLLPKLICGEVRVECL